MSLEKNKAIQRKLAEEFNKRNLEVMEEFFTPDYVDHYAKLKGLEDVKKFLSMLIKSLDFNMTIEDIIAEGDKVWVRYTFTGRHVGDFRGLAPTGEKFTESVVYIYRIDEDKIAEAWAVVDELDFLKKIGAIEYTERAQKLLPESAKQLL
jgi:predicted ester cyclase